ncbi:hypothetical protein L1987_09805 [Smallanthus sonchifolius]|uniref:Uncharacterized protein n=1 Tax=Smallanthus sonchifolius TaxID=185202 RepID=A0ACB9JQB5_9ASTR|nr:hypothetical protein L1987_09805 [Smallanthus sonchifolius]
MNVMIVARIENSGNSKRVVSPFKQSPHQGFLVHIQSHILLFRSKISASGVSWDRIRGGSPVDTSPHESMIYIFPVL